MPVYKIDGANVQNIYDVLKDLANACRDDDGSAEFADSYISTCDIVQRSKSSEIREKYFVQLTDQTGGVFTARSEDLLKKIYVDLRKADAEDGRLDGKINAGEDVEIVIKSNLDMHTIEKMVKPAVLATKLTKADGSTPSGTSFIVERKELEQDGKKIYHYTAFTAAHVVDSKFEEEKRLEVELQTNDGTLQMDAHVLGVVDGIKDFAVIEFETEAFLPVLALGDSDKVQSGDATLSLGYRLGRGISARSGNVVNTNHMPGNDYVGRAFTVSDFSTSGDSGGPVVDSEGRVIGIIFRVEKGDAGGQLTIAIPINDAKTSAKKILRDGKAAYADVSYLTNMLSHSIREKFSIKSGIYFSYIMPRSSWEKAGVKEGDILIAIDGDEALSCINNNQELTRLDYYLIGKKPGEAVKLKLLRDGKEVNLTVVLGEVSYENPPAYHTPYQFTALELTPHMRRFAIVPKDVDGVLASLDGRQWTSYGLPDYAVITHVDNEPVQSLEDFKQKLKDTNGDVVVFRYLATENSHERTGKAGYVSVPVAR